MTNRDYNRQSNCKTCPLWIDWSRSSKRLTNLDVLMLNFSLSDSSFPFQLYSSNTNATQPPCFFFNLLVKFVEVPHKKSINRSYQTVYDLFFEVSCCYLGFFWQIKKQYKLIARGVKSQVGRSRLVFHS